MLTAAAFDDVVAAIYRAASGEMPWPDALLAVRNCFAAWSVHLHGVDTRRGRIAFSHADPMTPGEAELDYVRAYHRIDPRAELAMTKPGELFNCWEHFDEDFVARDRFYQDFLIPYGGRFVSAATVLEEAELSVIFGVHRGRGSSTLAQDELIFCRRLARHLTDALRLHRRTVRLMEQGRVGSDLLAKLRAPVVLIDAERHLHQANKPARSLLRNGDALFARHGRLYCRSPNEDATLLLALRGLFQARSDGASTSRVFPASDGDPMRRIDVYLSLLRPNETLHAFSDRPLALAVLHRHGTRAELDPFIVATALGFTPGESRVAAALASGAAPQEIADLHRVSLHTVRAQIKAIYQKTGVTRQADLVSMLMNLSFVAIDTAGIQRAARSRPGGQPSAVPQTGDAPTSHPVEHSMRRRDPRRQRRPKGET